MIYTEEKMETMVPPAEEKEEEDVVVVVEEEEEDDVVVVEEEEEEDVVVVKEEEEKDVVVVEEEEKEETMPQTTDKIEKKMPSPEQPKEKKEAVLNLNNEVVKMRKEVKRVKTLVLRKLMRQSSALKKKKGNEANMEKNQNRAARLLKEIHVMKTLSPDLVTKTALVKKLNFDQVCKNPESTISDRAIARIATHSQFSKKIEAIRAAVQAFKEERMKGGKQEKKGGKQAGEVTPESADSNRGGGERKDKEEEAVAEAEAAVEQKKMDNEERDCNLKEGETPTVDEPSEKDEEKATPSAQPTDLQSKEMPETPETKSVRTASTKNAAINPVKNAPQHEVAKKKPNLKPAPKEHQKKEVDEESDLEPSDDEEKEYFDDSTEERFYKQSSQSDESDGDDDFFLGKVSRFKKKKSVEGEKKKEKQSETKSHSTDLLKTSDRECRLNSEVTKLQSVFFSTLSSSNPGRGKQGRGGRGKSVNEFRGRGRQRGGGPDGSSKFQKQNRQPEGKPGLSNSKSDHESKGKGVAFAGRGRGRGHGRGRGDVARQQDRKGQGVFSHQAPQQTLHPSWEASKKRKEQQGQILAFQGKKIKFGDDD